MWTWIKSASIVGCPEIYFGASLCQLFQRVCLPLVESVRGDGSIKLLGIRCDRSINHLLQRDIRLGREISNAFARRAGRPKAPDW